MKFILYLWFTTNAWLTIEPKSESFRVLGQINGTTTVQSLRATSDDSDAIYTWSVAHSDFDLEQAEYHASFFGVGHGYEFTCSATSLINGADSITLTIDADYGTYQSTTNENGIFSYGTFRTTFIDLEVDSNNNFVYNNEELTAYISCDKSIDLQSVWELYDSTGTLLASSSSVLPGPLEIGEIFNSNVQQATETNAAEVSTICPSEVTAAIISNGVNQLMKVCWRAWSIGTFNFNLGNYFYEELCQEISFTTRATNTSDVTLTYDVASFVVGETSRLELELIDIDLSLVDYTIEWIIGDDFSQQFSNLAFYDYRWSSDGIVIISYTISIPDFTFTKSGFESVFIRQDEQASYFNLVMESSYELGEEITFVPVSSIDQTQNSVEAVSSFNYAIELAVKSGAETIMTKQVEYFVPDTHVIEAMDRTGSYTVDSELLIVNDENELSFAKTSNTLNIFQLRAQMADVLPKEPIVPGERVDVEVIHNFYSFDPSRLEISWDFGDGQIDSGNAELASTSVIYPFGGLYNITCIVKSRFSEIEINSLNLVTVRYPITNPIVNVDELVAGVDDNGSNARATFFIGVDEGHPFSVDIEFGDETRQSFEVTTTRSILFDHTYNDLGNYTVRVILRNLVGSFDTEVPVRIIRPLPSLSLDMNPAGFVSTIDELTLKSVWSTGSPTLNSILYGNVEYDLLISSDVLNETLKMIDGSIELSMLNRPVVKYCLTIKATNGASCSRCEQTSPVQCFTPIELVEGLSITASRNTLSPGGQVQFTSQVVRGTAVRWFFRINDQWIETSNTMDYTFDNVGQFIVTIRAENNVSSVEDTIEIIVIDAPVISELTIQPDGDIYKETSRQFSVVLRQDSASVDYFTWKVLCQTNRELKTEQNTTENTFEFFFDNYGVYLFEVIGWNDVGPSEPFRLTNEVYEPIENLTLDIEDGSFLAKGEDRIVTVDMDFGSNVTIRVYPDVETFPTNFFPIFDRSILLRYDLDGTYQLKVVASNQISSDEVTIQVKVVTRIANIGCQFFDRNGVEMNFPAFVQLGTSGTISAFVLQGTDFTTTWSYNNQLSEGIEIPESFSFNEISDYQYSLTVSNGLGQENIDCVLSVRSPLTDYPNLEFISKLAYFKNDSNQLRQRCSNTTQCSPVFNSSSLMIIRIPRGHPDITTVRIKIDNADDVQSEFVYGNNRQKTITVVLDQTIGRQNVTVFVENGVSSLSREFTIITIAELDAISIRPVSDACLRDLKAPAAEVDVTCLLSVMPVLSSGFTFDSSEPELMGHFFDVDWYLDGRQSDNGSITTPFEFKGITPYSTSTVKAVLTDLITSRSFETEIDILTVPALEWNLVVDVKEFLYENNIDIFINDCLHFFVNVTNYDEQMILSANFTIEYKEENDQTIEKTIYPYTQEFPVYRPQDAFQHKFIEDKEYQVSAVVQNAARRYFSGNLY